MARHKDMFWNLPDGDLAANARGGPIRMIMYNTRSER